MGRKITEEHRQKIIDAQKKRWAKVRADKSSKQGRAAGDTDKGMAFRLRNPRIWSAKAVRAELEEVLFILLEDINIIHEKDLLSTRNYTTDYYNNWVNYYYDDEVIQNINNKIKDILESRIIKAVKDKKIPGDFGKFLLKSKFGYVEKNVSETTIKVDEEISDAKKEIVRKLVIDIAKGENAK